MIQVQDLDITEFLKIALHQETTDTGIRIKYHFNCDKQYFQQEIATHFFKLPSIEYAEIFHLDFALLEKNTWIKQTTKHTGYQVKIATLNNELLEYKTNKLKVEEYDKIQSSNKVQFYVRKTVYMHDTNPNIKLCKYLTTFPNHQLYYHYSISGMINKSDLENLCLYKTQTNRARINIEEYLHRFENHTYQELQKINILPFSEYPHFENTNFYFDNEGDTKYVPEFVHDNEEFEFIDSVEGNVGTCIFNK